MRKIALFAGLALYGAAAQQVLLEAPVDTYNNSYYFVGGYNPNIYLVQIPYDAPHTMSIVGSFPSGGSASYLAFGDYNLIAVNELDAGMLSSWNVEENDTHLVVKAGNSVSSGGGSPAFVAMTYSDAELVALAANYGGGNYGTFTVHNNGQIEATPISFFTDTGKGPVSGRQDSPHPHQMAIDYSGQYVFVPDLGTDKIMQYLIDYNGTMTVNPNAAFTSVKAGNGPRHMAFHPYGDWVYVTNELGNSLDLFDFDYYNGTLTFRATYSMVAAGVTTTNYPAEVALSWDGTFLYASNRGADTDNIAIFKVNEDDGTLMNVGYQKTSGQYPRFFTLANFDDWVLVANQNSNNLALFSRDIDSGELTLLSTLD
jgi:6-phosphogluconolactonase